MNPGRYQHTVAIEKIGWNHARVLRVILGLLVLCGCSLFAVDDAHGQASDAVTAVYGRGVHAYFAGRTNQAEQLFTEVIQAGSTDPRAYYFRAMVRLGMGRQYEAENDMRVGAAYEARNPGVQHAIGRSLQRVQGTNRRTLEKFRRQAKLDRVQQGRQQSQQRYEQLEQREPSVLRQAAPLPLSQPVQPPQLSGSGSANNLGSATTGSESAGSGTVGAPQGSGTVPPPMQAPPGDRADARHADAGRRRPVWYPRTGHSAE